MRLAIIRGKALILQTSALLSSSQKTYRGITVIATRQTSPQFTSVYHLPGWRGALVAAPPAIASVRHEIHCRTTCRGVTVGSDVVGLAVGSVGLAVGKLVGERLGTDDVGDSVRLLVTRLKICPS